jgi:DNA invertase Pin-like site-specific DNA recombinase
MAKSVETISKKDINSNKQMNVAAYCRVSTELEEQKSSMIAQINYYTGYINNHPDWKLVGIFTDTKSGVTAEDRQGFQKLLKKCYANDVNIIVTKSISRFSRNLRETLTILQNLKEKGVNVYFEEENIYSMDPNTQLVIALYGAQAQQESLDKSGNVRWGIQKRFQSGESKRINTPCYGFRNNESESLYINNSEAQVIQKIFHSYLNGNSINGIVKELSHEKILSPTGKSAWSLATVDSILSNFKYVGDVLLQKTFVSDTLTHKAKKNKGEFEQYMVKNNHQGIVTRQIFDAVQEERIKRSLVNLVENEKPSRYNSKGLSGLIECSECGRNYTRVTRSKKGEKEIVWRCVNRLEHGKKICRYSPTISEDLIKQLIVDVLNLSEYDEKSARQGIRKIIISNGTEPEIIVAERLL